VENKILGIQTLVRIVLVSWWVIQTPVRMVLVSWFGPSYAACEVKNCCYENSYYEAGCKEAWMGGHACLCDGYYSSQLCDGACPGGLHFLYTLEAVGLHVQRVAAFMSMCQGTVRLCV